MEPERVAVLQERFTTNIWHNKELMDRNFFCAILVHPSLQWFIHESELYREIIEIK